MKKEDVINNDERTVKPLSKEDIVEFKSLISDEIGIEIPKIQMLADQNIILGLRLAKGKKSYLSKVSAFSYAVSHRSNTPFRDVWRFSKYTLKAVWVTKSSRSKRVSIYKLFSYMLPRHSREEYIADLMEMNKDLKADGAGKAVIFLANLAHFTSIVFHGVFFKLSGYFYPSRKKVDE